MSSKKNETSLMPNDRQHHDEPKDGVISGVFCPICKSPAVERYKPFCSKRCADIDLGRWMSGSYAISGRDDDDDIAAASVPEANSSGNPAEKQR